VERRNGIIASKPIYARDRNEAMENRKIGHSNNIRHT
jgi:hypothetical protein